MPREIFFIADDFGLDASTNAAIIHAHKEGILHGAALMMGQPGTDEAIRLAFENPALLIGFHLHLNDSQPLTQSQWPWGQSPIRAGFYIGFFSQARNLVKREIQQQWLAFKGTGLNCAFINTHHHLHTHPYIYSVLLKTIKPEFKGWIRLGKVKKIDLTSRFTSLPINFFFNIYKKNCPFRTSDTLWGLDRTFRMNAKEIIQTFPTLSEGLHEFIFHPRQISHDPDTTCLIDLRSLV